MCWEDMKLGMRRYAKWTTINGPNVVLPANKQRVRIRFVTSAASTRIFSSDATSVSLPPGASTLAMVGIIGNGALTSMELSLEEHGDVVQGSFSSDTIGTFIWVMEVIDPYLDHPPPTSMYKEKPF